MHDFVQPVRMNTITAASSRKRESDKGKPFQLADGPQPESDDKTTPTELKGRYGDLDVGHKLDDEEGAILDLTG